MTTPRCCEALRALLQRWVEPWPDRRPGHKTRYQMQDAAGGALGASDPNRPRFGSPNGGSKTPKGALTPTPGLVSRRCPAPITSAPFLIPSPPVRLPPSCVRALRTLRRIPCSTVAGGSGRTSWGPWLAPRTLPPKRSRAPTVFSPTSPPVGGCPGRAQSSRDRQRTACRQLATRPRTASKERAHAGDGHLAQPWRPIGELDRGMLSLANSPVVLSPWPRGQRPPGGPAGLPCPAI
jgi:hypothetical protein